jgi:hypothetical protein
MIRTSPKLDSTCAEKTKFDILNDSSSSSSFTQNTLARRLNGKGHVLNVSFVMRFTLQKIESDWYCAEADASEDCSVKKGVLYERLGCD